MTPTIWPDAILERQMIEDADLVGSEHPASDESAVSDVACHVRALLARVRELEAERGVLLAEQEVIRAGSRVFGLEQQIAATKLHEVMSRFIGYALPIRRVNQSEWMAGYAAHCNAVLEALGGTGRVQWPGRWANQLEISI